MEQRQQFEQMLDEERAILNIATPGRVGALALSGGGIRAASVARGFLQKLNHGGLISRLHYISSVSGGGYAAAEFLVSRGQGTLARDDIPQLGYSVKKAGLIWAAEVLFRILPLVLLATLVYLSFPSMLEVGGHDFNRTILFATILISSLIMALALGRAGEKWRLVRQVSASVFFFLAIVWTFQMIGPLASTIATASFFILLSGYARTMPHRKDILDDFRHWPRWLIFCLTVSAMLWMAPSLIEFKRQYPAALWAIIGGVVLAYIYAAWTMLSKSESSNQRKYGEPVFSYYRNQLAHCFVKADQPLKALNYEGMPFPIFNTTAYDGRIRDRFEMTPLYFGSNRHQYIRAAHLPTNVTVADAMAASGGAVDGAYHDWDNRALTSLFFAGTGFWLFFVPGRLTCSMIVALMARVIRNTPSNRFLRLSDGGFTDNLGIVALLKRRVGLILCLDAAYDPKFEFEDLRNACQIAASEGIATIDTSDLTEFAHTHRFSGAGPRFLCMNINYGDGKPGVLILVKLASIAPTVSKQRFRHFPHITTSDQQLKESELDDLYCIGEELASECEKTLTARLDAMSTPRDS